MGAGGALQGEPGVGPRTLVESPGLSDASRLVSVALFHSGWGGLAEAPSGCPASPSPLEENALGSPGAALCRMKMTYSPDKRGALPEGVIAETRSQMEVGHSME